MRSILRSAACLCTALFLLGCPQSNPVSVLVETDGTMPPGDVYETVVPVDVVVPPGCETDEECAEGVCNPYTRTCVECMGAEDCPPQHDCAKWQCVPLLACQVDADCPEGLFCAADAGVCVECLEDYQCQSGLCEGYECVLPCGDGCPVGLVCDALVDQCVECLEDADCPEADWCFPVDSECVPDSCEPFATSCVGNNLATCADNGSGWAELVACPQGTLCVNGECTGEQVCVPGMLSCKDETTVLICNKTGTELFEEPCPPNAWCTNGQCVGDCLPDCSDQECGPSNCPDYSCGECPPGMQCDDGFCIPGGECMPGEMMCEGSQIIQCNQSGSGWIVVESCPPGSWCEDGACHFEGGPCEEVLNCMMDYPADFPPELILDECSAWTGPNDIATELFFCVLEMCNTWNPYGECFEVALKQECGWLYEECVGGCQPSCAGKQCGSDGCGGSCGGCPPNAVCQGYQCVPVNTGDCADGLKCMMEMPCPEPDPWFCMEPCMGPDGQVSELLMELFWCVTDMCGIWDPWDECFEWALTGECGWLYQECMGGCVPSCAGKQCGPDGCGGSCGWCPDGSVCSPAGKCGDPCEPMCVSADGTIKECGSDGCGGSCGVCPPGSSCNGSQCIKVCEPSCANKQCGSDGCGGSCGTCDSGMACSLGKCVASLTCAELTECMWDCPQNDDTCGGKCWQQASPAAKQQWTQLFTCVQEVCGPDAPGNCFWMAIQGECQELWNACQDCTPKCVGKDCGPDGCGGSCGECPGSFVCDDTGTCLCQPQCANKECGNDGCGGSCGTCPAGDVCNFLGYCICSPKCGNKQCGSDGCGGTCGTCPFGMSCSNAGQCVPGPDQCGNGLCQPDLGEDCTTCPLDCECGGDCCEPHPFPGCDDPEVTDCVCSMDPFCCQEMWDELCVDEAAQCGSWCGGCEPNCFNKECGPDGCSGSCGTCPAGSSCNSGGICEQTCKPNCTGKVCGSDGCGGSCGLCGPGSACKNGACVTALSCAELLACVWSCAEGDEACSSLCWQQASPAAKQQWMALTSCIQEVCGENAPDNCFNVAIQGACADYWYGCQECTPECVGKQCGADGCGGSCGTCPGGYACDNFGTCLCQPDCDTKSCGNDGCGGSCGTCPAGSVCNYLGHCVCMPQCQNKQCGGDGCGGSCGICPDGMQCNAQGQCKNVNPNHCGNGFCQPGIGETCANCPQDCGPCDQDGDCCAPHDFAGCADPDVMFCVCSADPFCCQGFWHEGCVELAQAECGLSCGSDPTWSCMDMFECAVDCGFGPQCSLQCFGNGSAEAQSKFQNLAMCVTQACGWNLDDECVWTALKTQCIQEYEACMAP